METTDFNMKKFLTATLILLATVSISKASLFGDTNKIRRELFNLFTAMAPATPVTPVKPVEPTIKPEVSADGWQFDQKRNVWWRLMPVNASPVAPQSNSTILPSTSLPNAVPRGIITSPFRSIQNCGPSG